MKARSIVGAILAAASLIGTGVWLAPRPPAAATRSAARAPLSPRDAAPARVEVSALRAEIRAAVRGALRELQPSPAPAAPEAPEPAAVAVDEPSDEQLAAAEQGRTLVEQAVTRGRFSEDDARRLRPMLAAMDADDASEVRLSIARSINAAHLTIDGPRALP